MSLLFAAGLVLMLRFIQPEQLLRVETLPDITDFFATLQSPITPLLPSFWAGEVLFAGLQGGVDLVHGSALWTTALAFTVLLGAAQSRWHFSGYSRSQEAPKTRFTQLRFVDRLARVLPLLAVRRQLFIKDVKVFLRDVSQWVQLLPLLALVLLYLYNFSVLDLDRVPYMSGVVKNFYAFVNLGDGGLRDRDRGRAFRVPGGVGGGKRLLDRPHVADLAARLPVVEVLDRSAAGAACSPRG